MDGWVCGWVGEWVGGCNMPMHMLKMHIVRSGYGV